MKVYITGRLRGKADKPAIESLSSAVRAAGMRDFCFARDVEEYDSPFNSAKERWEAVYDELGACDVVLVDVTDMPPGDVLIESGIAFALRKPVVVALKKGVSYNSLFNGISHTTIEYVQYKDITKPLRKFDHDRTFTLTDKTMLFAILLVVGGASTWLLAQLFLPLAPLWAIGYWFVARQLFASMRDFDRIVIYIPLATVWFGGIAFLLHAPAALLWGWVIGFWFVALVVIQKLKFSL